MRDKLYNLEQKLAMVEHSPPGVLQTERGGGATTFYAAGISATCAADQILKPRITTKLQRDIFRASDR